MSFPAAYLNGESADSGDANNALATAIAAAVQGQKAIGTGVIVSYSAAPAAGNKTITVKRGATTLFTINWTPNANEGYAKVIRFPGAVRTAPNQTLSVELSASGTGGVNGRAVLFYIRD